MSLFSNNLIEEYIDEYIINKNKTILIGFKKFNFGIKYLLIEFNEKSNGSSSISKILILFIE
nr:hypothetical protein [Clostridium cochlearium]